MSNLYGRVIKLEARGIRRSPISSERRKVLTDRAVLLGDQDALAELSRHRQATVAATDEQRAAALQAGLRADR